MQHLAVQNVYQIVYRQTDAGLGFEDKAQAEMDGLWGNEFLWNF